MDFDIASLPKPLAQLYSYWQIKRGDRLMPSRADINPVDMHAFLPHTMLIDVVQCENGETRFRTRLVGTHVVDGYGEEFSGKFLDEIDLGDSRDRVIEACLYTVHKKKPAYLSGKSRQPAGDGYISYKRLGVPLSSDGEIVNIILVAAVVQPIRND